MPSQDEIMLQIVGLVRKGAGGELSSEIEDVLHKRYYDWIVQVKPDNKTSPQDVWDEDAGKMIQGQIEAIGKGLAEKNLEKYEVSGEDCIAACKAVESRGICPHCPDDPTG